MALDSASTASAPITPAAALSPTLHAKAAKSRHLFPPKSRLFLPMCLLVFSRNHTARPSAIVRPPIVAHAYPHKSRRNAHPPPKRSPKELPRQISDRQRLRQHYRHGKRHEHAHGQHRIRPRMQLYKAALRSISYTSHRNHLRSGSDGHRTYHNAKIPPTQIHQRDFVISVQRSVLLSFNYFRFFKALMIRVAKSSVGSISRIF